MKKQKIKLIGLLRTVLLSWGMLLLVFACTIASTYPEVQEDFMLFVYVYIFLCLIFSVFSFIISWRYQKMEFDTSCQVIKRLRNTKQDFIWVSVFSVMAICALSMTVSLLFREYYLWIIAGLYILGESLSLVYFRVTDCERTYTPCPRGLLLLMLAELVLVFAVLGVAGMTDFNREMLLSVSGILGDENVGRTISFLIQTIATILSALSIFGIYKAKVSDRRWSALYSFGITIIGLCDLVSLNLQSTNLSSGQSPWFSLIIILATGCAVTGVSLY